MGEMKNEVLVEQPVEQDANQPDEQTTKQADETPEQSTDLAESNIQEAKIIESIENLPEDARARVVTSLMVHREFHGPIPPASDFALYDRTLPGASNRILKMAETDLECKVKLTQSNIDISNKIVNHTISQDIKGLWLGFVIALIAMVAVFTFGILGHDKLAISIVIAMSALVSIFVLRKNPKDDPNKKDIKE